MVSEEGYRVMEAIIRLLLMMSSDRVVPSQLGGAACDSRTQAGRLEGLPEVAPFARCLSDDLVSCSSMSVTKY